MGKNVWWHKKYYISYGITSRSCSVNLSHITADLLFDLLQTPEAINMQEMKANIAPNTLEVLL